jgi:flagellar capping protein FliD
MTTSNERLAAQVDTLTTRVGILETRMSQQELDQKALQTQLETVHRVLVNHVEATNKRFDAMDQRLDAMDQKLDAMDQKLDRLMTLVIALS